MLAGQYKVMGKHMNPLSAIGKHTQEIELPCPGPSQGGGCACRDAICVGQKKVFPSLLKVRQELARRQDRDEQEKLRLSEFKGRRALYRTELKGWRVLEKHKSKELKVLERELWRW